MAWLDGQLHETSIAPFDLADRGLLLGDGLFDTSLVLNGAMVWRQAHLDRLVASARLLGFVVDLDRVSAAIDAVLAGTKPASAKHGSLRVTVTRGAGTRGLAPPVDPKPTIFATLAPLRAAALFAPLRLLVTLIRRNDTSPTSRVKSLNYLDGVMASREALAAGCDDALFLNTKERVTCTSVGNVLALIGDQLVTPPIEDGTVAGTARGLLLRTCDALGLEAVERSLKLEDLDNADEVFVANSLRLVAPVRSIGRKTRVTAGRAQTIVAHMARLVEDETGIDPRRLAEG